MNTIEDIEEFVRSDPRIVSLLKTVSSIGLPDCWVAAGAIRNPIWSHLHGVPFDPTGESDVDVIYFDPANISKNAEKFHETNLTALNDAVEWEVRNQARMHVKNNDQPYLDSFDALEHWSETTTAIGARYVNGDIEIIAPCGVDDLLNLIVRPCPKFIGKRHIFEARIAEKNWLEKWPELKVI